MRMKGVKLILLASGTGERFGDPLPKQFHLLGGKPVYLHALETGIASKLFEEIVMVCHPDWIDKVEQPITLVEGGATRAASSYKGLLAAGEKTEIVLIHDATRPFVSERIFRENVEVAKKHGACDTCIASYDTLVQSESGQTIDRIPNRSHFLRGQTPQSFSYPLILKAYQKFYDPGATDDCQLILKLGHPVHIVQGEVTNIKITTPNDLMLAESLLTRVD